MRSPKRNNSAYFVLSALPAWEAAGRLPSPMAAYRPAAASTALG